MERNFYIKSLADYQDAYKRSTEDPELFWEQIANNFQWQRKWTKVLHWNFKEPKIKWFENGRLNITENCLDRHLKHRGDQIAMIWEPNDPQQSSKSLTYKALYDKVMEMAAVMRKYGIKKGDRVILYMNMILELPVAVLACARLGAIHSVIYGGIDAASIKERINDAQATFVLTQDAGYRGTELVPLKTILDEALVDCPTVTTSIVVQHTKVPIAWKTERDVWYHHVVEDLPGNSYIPAAPIDADDPLFILYTSGSTGRPKGVVHSAAGYMLHTAYTFQNVFQYEDGDIYYCTADIGWITGHSYVVYGPLLCGATVVMYEGQISGPNTGKMWEIIEKHQVNLLYTAPTVIRELMANSDDHLATKNLQSLKVLATVGEPLDEAAWSWYKQVVGGGRLPIVDTWWQTETGGIMLANIAGIIPEKASFATLPLPGIQPVLMNEQGVEIKEPHTLGMLCFKFPWPGMLRTTFGNHQNCQSTYFSPFENLYHSGDGAYRTDDGNYRIVGRYVDVLHVKNKHISSAELENAINTTDSVVESAVVSFKDKYTHNAIYAFVKAAKGKFVNFQEIQSNVIQQLGAHAQIDRFQIVADLPKTSSGKIMRRLLYQIANQQTDIQEDTSALINPLVLAAIQLDSQKLD